MGGSSITTNGDSPQRGTGTCQHPGGVQPPLPHGHQSEPWLLMLTLILNSHLWALSCRRSPLATPQDPSRGRRRTPAQAWCGKGKGRC